MPRRSLACSLLAFATACSGLITDPGASTPGDGSGRAPSSASVAVRAPEMGIRRLTVYELDNTLRDLLGDETRPASAFLPQDIRAPFDNDVSSQVVSQALVENVEQLALDVTRRWLADHARRDRVVGCAPEGPEDEACLRAFITSFGRLALRRPLDEDEIALYLGARDVAIEASDFYAAVEVVVASLLQDGELLYRVEVGAPVAGQPGLYELGPWEKAARLSFFLWSTTPDAWLLDRAAGGALDTPEGIGEVARSMLDDPRARTTIDRFHAMWLGYEALPHEASLSLAMRAETRALVMRVVFDERRPWVDVLTEDETFVNDALAEHYGIPVPGSAEPVWTPYGDSGRRGILSHGSFLSLGAKFGDTSPTVRGLEVRTRILCQEIQDPPLGVVTDEPIPTTVSPCKWDRFVEHRVGGCAGCHAQMDPIGFGLENYDQLGRFRTHDVGLPECTIEGNGELVGVGSFSGPAELGALIAETDEVEACLATQLYRFAMGRTELGGGDEEQVAHVAGALGEDIRLDELLLAIVSDEAFGYRREEE